jgi:hypothetical protein
MSFGLRSIHFGGMLAPPNLAKPLAGHHRRFPHHFGGRKQIILETIFLQNKNKTQNKAIRFFFIFKQQMFTSTIMGSNRCHDHFDLFALAQRAPDDLHSHENDEKKTRNH